MMVSRRLISSLIKEVQKQINTKAKYVDLPGTEMGKVVVRFPPEASGYLHIGHAKAALLNQYYQLAFDGKLIVRFDDTNPAKGDTFFERVIREDLKLLGLVPNQWTHSSDHFELLVTLCERMLVEGKAYVDNTDSKTMQVQREQQIESKNRYNKTKLKNPYVNPTMKKKFELAGATVVGDGNGPLSYLPLQKEEHPRTGNKYKVYPTYSFACPVIDSVEGVTHALRTTEYRYYRDQYYFICDALGLRKPYIWEYGRMNFAHTVVSKRKLTVLVDEKIVDGWDDPRLPTIRGLIRRGLTVEALKQFVTAHPGSRADVNIEWSSIWALNRKVIEPIAPKYFALEKPAGVEQPFVPIEIRPSFDPELRPISCHPANPDLGEKQVWFSPRILISQTDAAVINEGDVVTFMRWGNVKVSEVQKKDNVVVGMIVDLDLDNKNYKTTLKVTWLADRPENIPVKVIQYDHIIKKTILEENDDWLEFVNVDSMRQKDYLGEAALKNVEKGGIIELMRVKFLICDQPAKKDSPLVLIEIPDCDAGRNVKKS